MATRADGTDGSGAPRLNKSQVTGKSDSYGKTASKGIPNSAKTLSGSNDGSYGTKAARNSGGNVNGNDTADRSQISKSGGKWGR